MAMAADLQQTKGVVAIVKGWYRPTPHRRPLFKKKGGRRKAAGQESAHRSDSGSILVHDVTPEPVRNRSGTLDTTTSHADTNKGSGEEAPAKEGAARYYCSGRLTKGQFICAHVLVVTIVLSIVLIPLMYFVVAPAIIRSKVRNIPLSALNITTMDVQSFEAQGLNFNFSASLPAQFPIPMWARITPRTVSIQTDEKGWNDAAALATVESPPLDLNLKYPQIDMAGKLLVQDSKPLRGLMSEFSTKGLSARSIYARMKIDIGVFGITFYKNFEVEKPIEFPDIKNDLLSVWSEIPDWFKSPTERERSVKALKGELTFDENSFMILPQFPPLTLHAVDIDNAAKGPVLTAEISMANPTVATIKLPPSSFWLTVENERLANVRIEGLQLVKGVSRMKLKMTLEIASDARDKLPRAVYKLMAKIIGGDFLAMDGSSEAVSGNEPPTASLVGPFALDPSPFVAEITEPLELLLPIQQVLDAMDIPKLKNLITPSGVQKLLNMAQFNVTVTSTEIHLPFAINLPASLPLPTQQLDIPFSFSLAAAYTSKSLLKIAMHDLTMGMSKKGLAVRTKIVIAPENTQAAAEGMRDLVDSILVQAKPTTVQVRDMSLMVNNATLAWSDPLLKGLVFNAPVPGMDVSALFDAFTNSGTSVPLAMRSLLLHQLDAAPGFRTEASFDLVFPQPTNGTLPAPSDAAPMGTIPRISVDLGYAHASVSIDDALLANAVMPNGVKLTEGKADKLAANVLLPTGDRQGLTNKLQAIANALLSGQPLPSSLVIGGLQFGVSEHNSFRTFSLVRIPVSLAKIEPIAKSLVKTVLDQAMAAGRPLVVVRDADVKVASTVTVQTNIALANLWPLDILIGRMSLDLGVNGNTFARVSVGGITIKPDSNNALSLNIAVQLRNNDAVQDPLKQIVEAAWQTVLMGAGFDSPHAISISGLTIDSPANNAAGRIDHFSGLSVGVSLNTIVPLVPQVLKLVDANAILPESVASLMSAAKPSLQGADIATLEGQALRLTPTLGLNNPLALSASIAWASGDIVLGGGYFCTFEVANVTLARGPNTLSPSLTLRCGGTTDVAKDTLAQIVTDIVSEWRVKSRVEVASLKFGDNAQQAITILSKAVLPLPLQTVNLQPIVQPVLDSVLSQIPTLDSILQGTSSINPKLQSVSLRTLPDSSVSMGIAAELTNPLPFSATIGWLSLDAFLDGAALGKITIAPFNLGRGRTSLRTQITINGARGSGAADKVAQFVETFLSGGELRFRVGVANAVLGASDKDVITSFQRVRADLPLEQILRGTRTPIDLAGLVTSRLVGAVDAIAGGASSITIPLLPGMSVVVGQVGIDVQSGKKVAMSTSLRFNADFDVDVQVGHFAATALLNNVRMLTASLSDLKLRQNTDLSLGLGLVFADDAPIQDQVAELVSKLFDERIPGTIQLGQIAVGVSPTDTLDLLSAVKVGLPIEPIAKPIVGKVKSIVESILNNVANNRDLVTMGDNAITITLSPSVSIVVRDVSVATAPQKTLSISVRSDVKTPLPLSINVPFVGTGLTVNGQRVVTLGLRGLSLKNGGAAGLSLSADLRFDGPQSAADELARLVGVLVRSESLKGTTVGVQSPVFGVSFEDTINTFGKVNLGIDAGLLDNVVKSIRGLVDKVLGSINPRLINNGAKGFTLQLADNLAVDINSVDVRTQQGKTMAVDVDANLRLPIKVRVNIGHVGAVLSLNGAQLVAFETGIQLGDRLNKMTVVLRDFGESDDSQRQIAQLVSAVLGRQSPLPGNFGVSQAVLGVSREDVIDAFRSISVQLPVQTVAAPVLALLPANFDIVDIATQLGFQLGAIDVKALPDRRMSAGIQVTLNNPLPVSVSMGFASVALGSDGVDLVTAAINDLKLTSNGRDSLTLNVELSFADSEAAQDKLAALVRDPKSVTVGSIRFGASAAEPITLLAQTQVEVPMSLVNNDKFLTFALKQVGLTKDDLVLESLIKRVSLGSMNVAVKSAVEVDGSVSIALPVSISIDLPVIALVAYVDGAALSGVNVRDLKVKSEQGRIHASFRARLDMAATEPAQATVANLINKFLGGETKLQLGAGVGSVLFGATDNAKDIVPLARKVRIDVDVTPVVAYFRGMLPAKLDIVEIAQRFGVQMGKVAVKGQPGAKVDVGAQLSLNFTLPINVSVDYTALTIGLGEEAEIVTVEVGQLALRASARNTLSLNVVATFRNTQAAQDAVVAFLKNPTVVFFTGVHFGASPDDNIRLLAKAKLIAPASLFVNDKMFDFVLGQVGLKREDLDLNKLIQRLDIGSLDVNVGKQTTVQVDASIALPVDVSVQLPYAAVVAYLDAVPLAGVAVRDFVVGAREGGRIGVKCDVTLDLNESGPAQDKVADLVNELVANKNITLSAGVDSVAFGVSAEDSVQTLRKIRLDLNLTPFIDQIKSIVLNYAKTVMDWLVVENITSGLVDAKTMSASVQADVSKLPLIGRVSMRLQYATVEFKLNKMLLVTPQVTSLSLIKGKLSVALTLPFAQGEHVEQEMGAVIDQAADLLFFNPPRNRPLSAGVRAVLFGSNADSVVQLASKVNVDIDVLPYFRQLTDWYNKNAPFYLEDIQAELTTRGVDVDVACYLGPLKAIPMNLNIPSLSARVYYKGYGNTVVVDNWVTKIRVADGRLYFHLLIDPVWPIVVGPLEDAVPLLLSWKDVTQNGRLGGFLLHTVEDPRSQKLEDSFRLMYGCRMDPPPIYMFGPLSIRPILINPFKEGLGIDLDIGFDNGGPIHVNIGDVYFGLVNNHRNSRIGGATLDRAVLYNKAERKRNTFRIKARLTATLLDIPGLLIDLIAHRDRFGYKADIRWDPNTELVWLNRIIERMPPAVLANLWQILLGLIRNSSIRLFKEEGVKLAAATNATASPATIGSNSTAPTLSRRWLSRRAAVDETITKIEISKWDNEPVVPPEFQDLIKIDWSALTVATATE